MGKSIHVHHHEGAKWKWSFGITALVAILFVAGIYTNVIRFGSATPIGGSSVQQTILGSCGSLNAGFPKLKLYVQYLNQSNQNLPVQVATAYNAFSNPAGSSGAYGGAAAVTGVTSASQATFLNGTLNCGGPAAIFVGDGSTYATVSSPSVNITSGITSLTVRTWKLAQLSSMTFSNSTTFSNTSVTLGQVPAGGTSYTQVTELLRLGAGSYGPGGIVLYYTYNSMKIQSVVPGSGAVLDSNPNDAPPTTVLQLNHNSKTVAYLIPGQYTWGSLISIPLTITTTGGYTTAQGNTIINCAVAGKTGFLLNGVQPINATVNPNTGAGIGLPITQTANALEPTSTGINAVGGCINIAGA